MRKKTRTLIKKRTIAMILVMAIFAGILPDSFTAYAAEVIGDATSTAPELSMQFTVNNAWGGSIAAEIILKNQGGKDIRDWKLSFDWEPEISSLWGAQYDAEEIAGGDGTATGETCHYTIYPYEYNSIISPGSEVRIGLIASGDEEMLVEPDVYGIEADGESWVYDTKEDRLYVPGETSMPGVSEEPEITATPGVTEEPTKEPEITATPVVTEEPTEEPEITATPEATEAPTEEPTFIPEVTEAPTEKPETTVTPEPTEKPEPTKEPETTATPEPSKEPDYNLQDWEFTDDLTVTTGMTLTRNLSCGNLYIKSGTLKTNGHQVTVRKDAEQTGGTLLVTDGSTVKVKGSMEADGGAVGVHAGELEVCGDLTAKKGGLELHKEEAHILVRGNCLMEGRHHFYKGLLEVKGNLAIPDKDWLRTSNLVSIKLSGDKIQKVTVGEGTNLYNLDISESKGVDFAQTIYAKTLSGLDRIVSDRTVFAVDSLKLEKDEAINGDVEIIKGTWNTGNHRLTIAGDMELDGGVVRVYAGELEVCGDLAAKKGGLELHHEEAHVLVRGDCLMEGRHHFYKGLLEVRGNLAIPDRDWLRTDNLVNIKLSGDGIQKVTVEEGTNLYNLDLTESGGVIFSGIIRGKTLRGIEKIRQPEIRLEIDELKLSQDTELDVGLELVGGNLKTCGFDLQLRKDLALSGGNLYVTDKSVVDVKGSMEADGGVVNIHAGKLEVCGNFTAKKGGLELHHEEAHVLVKGNCLMEGRHYFYKGLLEARGNLAIPDRDWLRTGNFVNIKLSGSRTQKVTVEEGTYLYNLDLTESAGVDFAQTVYAKTLCGLDRIVSDRTVFAVDSLKLEKDEAINGDVEIIKGTWNTGNHRLAIAGDMELDGGVMRVYAGELEVCGDLAAKKGGLELHHEEARVLVRGDCLMEGQHHFYGGILEVKGDLAIPDKDWLRYSNDVNIKLSGGSRQKVTVEEGTNLYNLDISESNGVKFATTVYADILYGVEKLAGKETTLNVRKAENSVQNASVPGNIVVEGGSLRLDGYYFNLEGNLTLYGGIVNTGGGAFTVKGSCILNGGALDLAAGEVTIEGNCSIKGNSSIYMAGSTSALEIGGNLTSSSTMDSHFLAGNIYLGGDLKQTQAAAESCLRMGSRLHLNGKGEQELRLLHPEESTFSFLDMKNAKGVEVQSVIYAKTIYGLGHVTSRCLMLCGWEGEVSERTLYQGELILMGCILTMRDHLWVEKLEQVNSHITVEEGGIWTQGDYIISGDSRLIMQNAEGVVNVGKSFYTASTMSHNGLLTDGSMYIGENLLQEGYIFNFYITDNFRLCFTQLSPQEGGKTQVVCITGEMSEIIEKQKSGNFHRVFGANVEVNNILIENLTPESIYRNFCEGMKEGAGEIMGDLGNFFLWTTIGTATELAFHGFGMAVDMELVSQGVVSVVEMAGTAGIFAMVVGILFSCGWELYTNGGNVNLLARKAGKATAEVLITAIASKVAAAAVENLVITPKRFQKLVEMSAGLIKDAYATGKAAVEKIILFVGGTEGVSSLLQARLSSGAVQYLDDLVRAGSVTEDVLQRSYSFIDDTLQDMGELGTVELQTVLENAGSMENGELSKLVRWLNEQGAATNGRALEYMDDTARKYLWEKSGDLGQKQLDDILDDILKEVEAAPDDVVEAVDWKRVRAKVESSNNSTYKEINIHGKISTELDEVDLINKIIYEDKNATKLYMDNPDFFQTEEQWAYKQIFKKGSNRIEALQQADFTLSSPNTINLPSADELRNIRNFIFRIDADTPELRVAVQKELDNLKAIFPDYNFDAIYGGGE